MGPDGLSGETVIRACALAFAACGVTEGHAAVAVVDADEMSRLNSEHRGLAVPTDVLSFPVDGTDRVVGPRELGDVVLCPPLCSDLLEAAIHGALHLVGMDHETDSGEMLALQAEILRWESN